MGFWDAVGSVFTSAKCLTGFHGGKWTPVKGQPKCHLEKTCPDCDKHITKVKHEGGEWKHIHGKPECHKEITCIHCNEHMNKKFFHKWDGQFKPRSDFYRSCTEERRCVYCNKVETRLVHDFSKEEVNEFSCRITKVCARCGFKKQTYQTDHQWGNWHFPYASDDKSYKVRECSRCGETEKLRRS